MKNTQKLTKKLIGIVLSIAMLFSVCIPVSAQTEDINSVIKELVRGETLPLEIGGFNIGTVWSSSDESIAAVDENGVVYAEGLGDAVISAHVRLLFGRTKTESFYIKVTEDLPDLIIEQGERVFIETTLDGKITWTSSDESTVSVDGGFVTGVSTGTATVTASAQKGVFFKLFGLGGAKTETFTVKVVYPSSTDGKYLSAEVAALFGVSPDEYDTDGDGLNNYVEAYITGTDLKLSDTDGNGVPDGGEDNDGDGLSNAFELDRGTMPSKKDTDGDGLSDFEEINVTSTDPLNADTDGDTLSDKDETVLGLDPLSAVTDGKTPDSDRSFSQTLSEENIDPSLLDEKNGAVLSLRLTAKGNINSRVSVHAVPDSRLTDSRAVTGKAAEVQGKDIGHGKISFTLTEASDFSVFANGKEESFNTNLICRYTDGVTEYLPTKYDAKTNTVTSEITEAGTYFVLDVKKLFGELGHSFPEAVNADLATSEPSRVMSTSDVMVQADIVFLIDTTGSMSEEIRNVKENIGYFVDQLNASGVSVSLALIDYQDLEADGESSTRVHKNGDSNWFYDIEDYKDAISALTLGDGGDYPECAVDALETGRLLDMRASAGKFFILVTDSDYKTLNRYGIPSMEYEIELLKNSDITCAVASPNFWQSKYYPLYSETNGSALDIYGDFHTELTELAEVICDQTVGDGYWIYLDGTVPTAVRLDEKPYEGSTVDTDGDGVPDVLELKSTEPTGTVDLDALITQISGGTVTGTNYGVVETYEFKSNPALIDTDFDGVNDKADNMPKSSLNKGIMHYEYESTECAIEFNMDYRDLIDGDNTVYSRDLSILSMLYASDVYDNSYIEITEGATVGGSDDGRNLGTLLGLEADSQFIPISASEYGVDKDDVTDFFVGHKKIVYNGKENEVIIVSVRGTNATNAEWSSNFDVGADTAEYYSATGYDHPDWHNKENHKGFDVTANRIYNKLMKYIDENVDTSLRKTILIVGHSRGAAIANILGARFEKDHPEYTSFTYTFATPYTTLQADAEGYETVFNVVNEDDLITYLPLSKWGFKKFGTTRSISIRDNYASGTAEGSFQWLVGASYNDDGGTQRTLDCFGALADSREDLYILDPTEDGKAFENGIGHLTKAGAENELAELTVTLTEEKLYRFCTLTVVGGGIWWRVQVNYCPAYFMQVIANMTTGVGPVLGRNVDGAYATAKTSFVASSGVLVVGGLTHPHMQPTYYLIARNDFLPLS